MEAEEAASWACLYASAYTGVLSPQLAAAGLALAPTGNKSSQGCQQAAAGLGLAVKRGCQSANEGLLSVTAGAGSSRGTSDALRSACLVQVRLVAYLQLFD